MTLTPPANTLDAATAEFVEAFNDFMICQVTRFLVAVPEIAETAMYIRLMNAAAWLDAERQKHAAEALFGTSADYDDDTVTDMLKGICG